MRIRWLATAIALLPGFAANAATGEGSARTLMMNDSRTAGEVAIEPAHTVQRNQARTGCSLFKRIRVQIEQRLHGLDRWPEDRTPQDFAINRFDDPEAAFLLESGFTSFLFIAFKPFSCEIPGLSRRGPPCI